jgi:hypothetical protein
VFSVAPTIAASRANPVESLGSGVRSGAGSAAQSRTRSLLVVVEVASAVLLLIGAALLIRSSIELNRVDPGFDSANVVTLRTGLNGPTARATENVTQVMQSTRAALRAVAGVVDAAAASSVPGEPGWGLPFNIPGRENEGLYTGGGSVVFASAGYFDVLGIPVVRGRAFDDDDRAAAPPVVVINEALAQRYWPDGADPLGERILVGGGAVNMQAYADEPLREIVGIVADVRTEGLAREPAPAIYVPHAQLPDAFNALLLSDRPMTWIARTQAGRASSAAALRQAVESATLAPVTDVRTMDEVLARSISRQRLQTWLLGVFGAGCSACSARPRCCSRQSASTAS